MKLVFLHGLLGTADDWQNVIERCSQFDCIALNLPFHGKAQNSKAQNFEDCCQLLDKQIQSAVKNEPFFLIGYSLGGRIALYYALQAQCHKKNLQGLVLEGANLGLIHETEKAARWQHDLQWATRFCTEPAPQVLEHWYQQPVFAHLTPQQRQVLIEKRTPNCGANIGKMLTATSLAKQPYFGDKVRSTSLPIYYLVGEKDLKFRQVAERENLNMHLVPHAGHNAHLENPQAFAQLLTEIVGSSSLL